MKKSRRYLGILAVIVAVGIVFGGFLAEPIVAQIRAAFVKDLNNPAYQPFAVNSGVATFPSSSTSVTQTLLTVPAGKRAVIEHFSCINFLAATNNFVRFEILYTSAGGAKAHQFVNTRVGESFVAGVDIWSLSQPVRAYADPSTTISVNAFRRSGTGLGGIECELSGHLVDTTP